MSDYESDTSDSDSSLEIVSKAKPVEEPVKPDKPAKRAYTKKKQLSSEDVERRRIQAEKMRKAKAEKAAAVKAEKEKAKAEALPVSVQRNGKKTRAKETIINNYYYSEPKSEPEPKPVLNIKPSAKPVARPAVPPTPKRSAMVFF
jgi:type IV secretory pathway VirB9-like protein